MPTNTLNVSFVSDDWRGVALSNFCLAPFVMDGVLLASVEGFIQGIKFPEGNANRQQAFTTWEWAAKKAGQGAQRNLVYWAGQQLPFGSPAHHALVERALRAKFAQNQGACLVLKATGRAVLVHNTDEGPEPALTSLPAARFCQVLTDIRARL
ncbi:hypothetical protein [Castellaniella sp.]|uniref:hypothetical protein n=1 Tax=Castellaniella sp. TaxID=1955812 RepID=UPI003C78756B